MHLQTVRRNDQFQGGGRRTFTQNEYQKIAEIKAICLKSKVHVKKSEVLGKLSNAQLKKVLSELEKNKTGRLKKY
jgi:hypothetical protein